MARRALSLVEAVLRLFAFHRAPLVMSGRLLAGQLRARHKWMTQVSVRTYVQYSGYDLGRTSCCSFATGCVPSTLMVEASLTLSMLYHYLGYMSSNRNKAGQYSTFAVVAH